MAKFYVESNDEGTRELFEKRNYYGSRLSKTGYKNVVDFNFGEKFFYGRVDQLFIPITFNRPVKRFKKTIANERGMGAVNFVVDAFNDMAQQFERCALYGSIDTTDPFLTNIKIHKAYQNPGNMYREYREQYFGAINTIFVRNGVRVRNFDDFIDKLMPVLQRTVGRNPLTKTAYIKSKNCPIMCSGLALEIADIDPSDDQDKIDQFVNSKNWNFYLNACASYGFMVDKNIPWRIVADIGNLPTRSPMLDYAEKYGLVNPTSIFKNYYTPVHESHYYQFKTNLLNLYNRVKLKNFLETDDCEGTTVTRIFRPTTYTRASFSSEYSDSEILKIYFNIRAFEEEIEITDSQINLLIDDCMEIYRNQDIYASLDTFERIINLPFDKRGSLSYIKKQTDALQDSKI
tara:strand:+ start:528 stop:1733 length:1206 start_codon:yes stop_codon:yes gene_type:complete